MNVCLVTPIWIPKKGFEFFQKFMKTNGILDELEAMGIEEGDTVKMYGWQFDYYK